MMMRRCYLIVHDDDHESVFSFSINLAMVEQKNFQNY